MQPIFSLTRDEETLPMNPATAAAHGQILRVPVMLGNTAEFAMWSFIYDGGSCASQLTREVLVTFLPIHHVRPFAPTLLHV